MAVVPDQATTSICTHCDRAIPSANIDLHYVFAPEILKNVKFVVTWFQNNIMRTTIQAPMHHQTMERDILDIHKGKSCPQRIVTCDFCEFPLSVVDLLEHQEVCGNQTELCHRCNKHVRLRERYNHEDSCNRIQNNGVGSSRNVRRPVERGEGARRRQPNGFSTRRLLFTIAITGITVILGSIFFQRKAETSSVH